MRKGIVFFLLTFLACSKAPTPVKEIVLARIGPKTISVNEFIKRSEYTIRPVWCKNDDYISKKIVLNSLIAEKLLAIEAGKDSVLLRNPGVENYLKGRKEQIMRNVYQNAHGIALATVDSQFVGKVASFALRRYRVNILGAASKEKALDLVALLKNPRSVLSASLQANDSLKTMEITFQSPLSDAIIKALYFKNHLKGDLIGPVKLDGRRFVVLKIKGWTRHLMLSEQKSAQNFSDVMKRVSEIEGMDIYAAKISELMQGKSVHFNETVFKTVVNAIAPVYFRNEAKLKKAFNKKFWNKDNSKMSMDDLNGIFDRLSDKTFFKFSGKNWSVADFERAIQSHPLVFRNRKMPKQQFANQFRLAIVDLLRDKIITDEAYAEGLDKDPRVLREMDIWRDNLLALHQREKLLKKNPDAPEKSYAQVKKVFDPFINQLRKKYSNKIFINTREFEKVKLSAIDMFAIRKQEAFPVVVPEFPQLTLHNALDYGHKLEEK